MKRPPLDVYKGRLGSSRFSSGAGLHVLNRIGGKSMCLQVQIDLSEVCETSCFLYVYGADI